MSSPFSITGKAPTLHSDIFSMALNTVASGSMVKIFELLLARTDVIVSDTSIVILWFVDLGVAKTLGGVIEVLSLNACVANGSILGGCLEPRCRYKC